MGNSVSLRDYLLSTSESYCSEQGSESEDASHLNNETNDENPLKPRKTSSSNGSSNGGDRRVSINDAAAFVEPAFQSQHEGGRLREVTPVKFNDHHDGGILKIRHFGPPPQTNGSRARGLAPVDDPFITNDEIDEVDNWKINPFTLRKQPQQFGDSTGSNRNLEERFFVNSRLPKLKVDMPAIFEGRDTSTEERRSRRKSRILSTSQDGDSLTLSASHDGSSGKSRTILGVAYVVLLIIFLILLGLFLYYVLREDGNDIDGDRGMVVPIPDTPTMSPPLGRLLLVLSWGSIGEIRRNLTLRLISSHISSKFRWDAVPTVFPGTVAPSIDSTTSLPTSFPTFSGKLWEAAGDIIPHDDSIGQIAVSLSFDGRTMVTLQGDTLQRYQWQAFAWRKRGSTVRTTTWVDPAIDPAMAMSTTGVALSLDGKTLAIAAVENDFATITPGMVRVYRLEERIDNTEELWTQAGQTLVGTRDEDRFGAAVALSGSGLHLAVGAPANDHIGGPNDSSTKSNVGQVRVFRWNENVGLWVAYGQSLRGTATDQSIGEVVSLSNDGYMLAVAGTKGGLMIHRLNSGERWIQWGFSGVSAPNTVSNAALSGSGKVVALSDSTTGAVRVYQGVSW
eukprot:scaffold34595_cov160-Amphora_coffeaeformis.AAC.3